MHNQISKMTVLQYKHQVVRDLAWSLWGPALLIHEKPYDEFCNQEAYFAVDEPWLEQLDARPQHLLEYLESKNTRLLGTYFEALWQFYFSHHSSFKYSICNLQINDKNRTLGEFDVLLTNNNDQNFHIELACKFYLEWQDSSNNTLWLGPNCGDRLDFKYHKTQTHQLPLLNSELGQLTYQLHAINRNPIRQMGIWRGRLFHKNKWFKANQLPLLPRNLTQNETVLWCIVEKKLWLSPLVQGRDNLKTFEQIKQVIKHLFSKSDNNPERNNTHKHTPLMLAALTFNEDHKQWHQQETFFITPNDWPYGKLSDSALTPLRPCKPPL